MSDIPGKVAGFPLQQGDFIVTHSSGGGGYGDPLSRPAEWVKNDFESGYVSIAGALADYGVVIDNAEVDMQATESLRDQLRRQRVTVCINATEEDSYDNKGRRLLQVSRETAKRLEVTDNDIVEYVPESGVPLRAWIKVDLELKGESSPLGSTGQAMIGLSEGDSIWIRTPWTSVSRP